MKHILDISSPLHPLSPHVGSHVVPEGNQELIALPLNLMLANASPVRAILLKAAN